MQLQPLPTKTRVSFDIPKLLEILEQKGEYYTTAEFEDLLTVRNYIMRHGLPFRLSQKKLKPFGYKLTLNYDKT